MRNTAYGTALKPGDGPLQTVGCRLSNPATCSKNSLAGVCAFVRPDGTCVSPPESWPKQFAKLQAQATAAPEANEPPPEAPAADKTVPPG